MALRLRAVREHQDAFLVTEEEELARPIEVVRERLAAPDSVTLGAWLDDELVGSLGFLRQRRAKIDHKAEIWGMYVVPERRGAGVGRTLLVEAIRRLGTWKNLRQVQLAVTAHNKGALALYEALGFRTWGVEPGAMCVDGAELDEIHMWRSIPGEPV